MEDTKHTISYAMRLKPKPIQVAMCITSRYYKGFSNYNPENAVIVEVKDEGKEDG